MDGQPFWAGFILAALATWRLSVFLVSEDGPFDLARRVRALAAGSELGRTFDCIACTSLVVALPATLLLWPGLRDAPICWLAISGAAILFERITGERLVIEARPDPHEGQR